MGLLVPHLSRVGRDSLREDGKAASVAGKDAIDIDGVFTEDNK